MNDTDADKVLAAYPACRHAVAYCGLFLDAADLADMRRIGLDGTLDILRECLAEQVAEQAPGDSAKWRQALAELDTAGFRRYLAAVFGHA